MKMTLSIPSTISRTVRVRKPIQAWGSPANPCCLPRQRVGQASIGLPLASTISPTALERAMWTRDRGEAALRRQGRCGQSSDGRQRIRHGRRRLSCLPAGSGGASDTCRVPGAGRTRGGRSAKPTESASLRIARDLRARTTSPDRPSCAAIVPGFSPSIVMSTICRSSWRSASRPSCTRASRSRLIQPIRAVGHGEVGAERLRLGPAVQRPQVVVGQVARGRIDESGQPLGVLQPVLAHREDHGHQHVVGQLAGGLVVADAAGQVGDQAGGEMLDELLFSGEVAVDRPADDRRRYRLTGWREVDPDHRRL